MLIAATSPDAMQAQYTSADVLAHVPLIDGIEISLARTAGPGERMTEADRTMPGTARRVGLSHLRRWCLHSLMDDAALLISELVTNAFQHGQGPSVSLRLLQTNAYVRLEVTDGTPAPPAARTYGLLDEHGRGLPIVAALADAWGVTADGTRTWCILSIGTERSS
ncbi:ATP-binding protein [Streptomyces sp. NPDC003016]